MNYKQQLSALGGLAGSGLMLYSFGSKALFNVDTGHKAFLFNRFSGVKETTFREGLHFKIPMLEYPVIYNVKTQPTTVDSTTGTKDMQTIKIALRVLYRPDENELQHIYRNLGKNYDERVLPSVVNEVLKSVVAQYNAQALLSQRELVSQKIRNTLEYRLKHFNILLDDVSIVQLTFGQEFTKAIEQKQIAQQQAERAKYLVDRAVQDKKSTIIRAEGESMAAEAFGKAMSENPAYIDLKRIEAAQRIAEMLGSGRTKVYLDSDSLLLNLTQGLDKNLEKKPPTWMIEQQRQAATKM